MAKKSDKDTKDKIFIASAKLFATKGFHAASMREIAKEADVNLALINYHFSNKDNLFHEVIAHGVSLFEEIMAEHRGKKLEDLLRLIMKETSNKKGYGYYLNIYMRLFLDQVSDVNTRTDIFTKGPPGIEVWREAVKEAIGENAKEKDVVLIAHMIVGYLAHNTRIQFGLAGKTKKNNYLTEYLPKDSEIFTELIVEFAMRLVNEVKLRSN